jgi:hypothetical protein
MGPLTHTAAVCALIKGHIVDVDELLCGHDTSAPPGNEPLAASLGGRIGGVKLSLILVATVHNRACFTEQCRAIRGVCSNSRGDVLVGVAGFEPATPRPERGAPATPNFLSMLPNGIS